MTTLPSAVFSADKFHQRFRSEAIALFHEALADYGGRYEQCELPREWQETGISSSDLRRYLGERPKRSLSAPYLTIKPADVLDPKGEKPEAFCSEEEADARSQAFVKSYQGAAGIGEKKPNGPHLLTTLRRITLGFPVFNSRFTRAVIFRTRSELSMVSPRNASALRPLPELTVWIEIYRKNKGKWDLHAYHLLGIT
ncbi:hypothetical protein [Microvirga sp. 17 mud 1-3]|uniref:hypothetical protein n=1 Tax=Microvirga sp. 17 mud 1-3 TaxID=2082949 RepID=UPI0013A5BC70|nr:hypothetical protein [Microvirga sp. 17 mud 1-3]